MPTAACSLLMGTAFLLTALAICNPFVWLAATGVAILLGVGLASFSAILFAGALLKAFKRTSHGVERAALEAAADGHGLCAAFPATAGPSTTAPGDAIYGHGSSASSSHGVQESRSVPCSPAASVAASKSTSSSTILDDWEAWQPEMLDTPASGSSTPDDWEAWQPEMLEIGGSGSTAQPIAAACVCEDAATGCAASVPSSSSAATTCRAAASSRHPLFELVTVGDSLSPRLDEAAMLSAKVVKQLGRGANGVVHLVELVGSDGSVRRLARKTLPCTGSGSVAAAKQEIRGAVMSSAKTPFAVDALGAQILNKQIQIFYELADDGTLEGKLAASIAARPQSLRSPHLLLPIDEIRKIAYTTLSAVAAFHESGLLHGDVKPENVYVSGGRYLLGDAGNCADADAQGRVRGFRGSGYFVAPEQFECGAYGLNADCYSVGILLCECSVWYYSQGDVYEYTRRNGRLPDCVPEDLRQMIEALTAADPTKRPSAAQALQLPFVAHMRPEDCL